MVAEALADAEAAYQRALGRHRECYAAAERRQNHDLRFAIEMGELPAELVRKGHS